MLCTSKAPWVDKLQALVQEPRNRTLCWSQGLSDVAVHINHTDNTELAQGLLKREILVPAGNPQPETPCPMPEPKKVRS